MIKATVISGSKTAATELPCDKYDLYEVLQSIGIRESAKRILLTDNEGDDIRVRLTSDSDFGNHLIRLFNGRSTLGDINSMCLRLQNTREEIRDELEQNLLNDQYSEPYELTADIRELTESCGVVKVSFVCPLVGSIEDSDYNEPQTISNQHLKCFEYEIGELLESEQSEPEDEMAQYFNADDRIKDKLVSVVWTVDEYNDTLYGKIDCSFTEPLTEAETEVFKSWLVGQCADGVGEHLEQQPIETEDGDLFVSFWNSSDSYFLCAEDELDDYIRNETGFTMGGM